MKKRGFTLIELLAVIVILAVIALIATPLIMGTITKAKKNAFIDTANGILKAGENYQAEQVMTTAGDVQDLIINDLTSDTKLQYKGSKPKSGSMKITSEGKTAIAIWSGQFCAIKGLDDKQVTVDDSIKTQEACVLPVEATNEICFDTQSNGSGVKITGYDFDNPSCPSDITIPETIAGKTVNSIGYRAFVPDDEKQGVTSVSFPSTITIIEDEAFYWHRMVGELNISNLNDITSIGREAFYTDIAYAFQHLYIPNKYINYLNTNSVITDFYNSTLKIKKGSIPTDDIVADYMSQGLVCEDFRIGERIRETEEFVEYRIMNRKC